MIVLIKVFDGQPLHVVKHFFTHFLKRALSYYRHKLAIRKAGYEREHIKGNEYGDEHEYLTADCRPIARLPALLDHGNNVLHKHRLY